MNKKAVSPVIATLLLVVIAVAAAVITYVWITGYLGTLQQQSGAQQVQERLKIDAVEIASSGKALTIYVRNIGDVQIKIADAYLLDEGGSLKANKTINTSLDPGKTLTAQLSWTDSSLTNGKTYVVKVITEKGTEATYQFIYRKS
ncbi:MAG: hypothetical protein DRJ47_00460 [Thermoprotei archaeon]|nr:MAG: hypothetical protein DRJ47_00460 [Thermoprotei archaeon]